MLRVTKTQNSFLVLGLVLFLAFFVFYSSPADAQDAAKRTQLEAQIAEIEQEIASLDGDLEDVQEEKRTLENEIYRLNTEIKRTELAIQGLNLSISRTQDQITLREINIDEAQSSVQKQHSSLAEFIRILHKASDRTLVEVLLAKDLSQFFREVDVLASLQENAQASLGSLKILKTKLETEQEGLRGEQEEFYGLRSLENNQKQALAGQKGQKDSLLDITKGEEAAYQRLIGNKKRDIAAIRSQIFYLEQTGVTAEDAVRFAELAANRTGIRTSFLLGLLEVETGRRFAEGVITAGSNLGSGNWREDMHPTRDQPVFAEITSRLGLDPDKMPVSAKPSYGWGGAMGPAQFIPSTWVIFEDRIANLTGHDPPNPWVVEDAFTGAALYLADRGAKKQNQTGESGAAKAYISGSSKCTKSICIWYAREVLRVAALIEPNL